jgi:hypothetical protein
MAEKVTPRKVYIHGFRPIEYIRMFIDQPGYVGCASLVDADILVLTGGADVDPAFYGERPHRTTRFDELRDESDSLIMAEWGSLQKKEGGSDRMTIGICRGGQFLNIWNGGRMWQNVNHHAGVGLHDIIDADTGQVLKVTSTHHQMMIPHESGRVIAIAREADYKEAGPEINTPDEPGALWLRKQSHEDSPDWDDTEVVWYEETRTLCFQPHPEMSGWGKENQTREYFFNLIDRFF